MKISFFSFGATSTIIFFLAAADVLAAGCVVSRGAGMSGNALGLHKIDTSMLEDKDHQNHSASTHKSSPFQTTLAFRSFRSDRHFVGKDEQEERQREGSEVINQSRFVDLSLGYSFNRFYSASLTIPFAYHDRSQVVRMNNPERTILQRFHTQSTGLGDLQLTGSRWLFDPESAEHGNIAIGLGIDMPTGKDDVKDTFMVYDAASQQVIAQTRHVDQSIQLGDGGWGMIMEVNAYYAFSPELSGYFNGSYTLTPEEKNGVATSRSNPFEAEMSIPDTYLARTGMEYSLLSNNRLTLSLGTRVEGVTVHDLVGGSTGFRRPGYDISIEPGVALAIDSWLLNLYVPISVERNRQRSVPDAQFAKATNTPRHGDAAFSDYSITFAVSKSY